MRILRAAAGVLHIGGTLHWFQLLGADDLVGRAFGSAAYRKGSGGLHFGAPRFSAEYRKDLDSIGNKGWCSAGRRPGAWSASHRYRPLEAHVDNWGVLRTAQGPEERCALSAREAPEFGRVGGGVPCPSEARVGPLAQWCGHPSNVRARLRDQCVPHRPRCFFSAVPALLNNARHYRKYRPHSPGLCPGKFMCRTRDTPSRSRRERLDYWTGAWIRQRPLGRMEFANNRVKTGGAGGERTASMRPMLATSAE